jgi:hypothetical protein
MQPAVPLWLHYLRGRRRRHSRRRALFGNDTLAPLLGDSVALDLKIDGVGPDRCDGGEVEQAGNPAER